MNFFYEDNIFCLKRYKSLINLVFFDFSIKFRRTFLGPIWSILTILISISVLSLVWSYLFKIDLKLYLPNLLFGLTIYQLFSNNLNNCANVITGEFSSLFQNTNIPLSYLVLRNVMNNFLNYMIYLPVFLLVIFLLGININIYTLLFFFSITLIFIICFLLGVVISIICSRYRDIQSLVATLTGIGTFLTPVLWDKSMLGKYENFAYLNPLTFIVEAIKYPLLGKCPGLQVFIGIFIMILISYLLANFLYNKTKFKIIFWSN